MSIKIWIIYFIVISNTTKIIWIRTTVNVAANLFTNTWMRSFIITISINLMSCRLLLWKI